MATEKLANNAGSTLSGTISNSATSLTVGSAAGFPTTGQFRILIESEILLVTGVAGTTFTVTRGQDGTSAASHASGVNVDHILTRDGMKQFRADLVQDGDYSSRPSNEIDGRVYLSNDGRVLSKENGSAWKEYGPINRMHSISASTYAQFAWGSAANAGTETWTAGTMMIEADTNTPDDDSLSAFTINLADLDLDPNDDWRITAHIWGTGIHANYAKWGVVAHGVAVPAGGLPDMFLIRYNTWGVSLLNGTGFGWINEKWRQGTVFYPYGFSDFRTSFDSNQTTPNVPIEIGKTAYWTRVSYISGDYVWEISLDGIHWYEMTSYDDSWVVHDSFGIFIACQNNERVICCCDSFMGEAL